MKNLIFNAVGKTRYLALLVVLIFTCGNVWAQTTTTYTFSSKSWAASPANWTNGKAGNALTSGKGIQVTKGTSGANGTSPKSFTNVSKVVITYSTNASKGAGSIAVKIGSNTASSQNVTTTGGTTDRTLTYNFSPNQTGNVIVTVTCTTNSIYVKSVAITEAAATKTYHEWNGSNQFTTSTGGSTLKAVPSLCDWAIEPFGWCSEENYASSTYPTDKIWFEDASWPAGKTDLYALYRVGSDPYYYYSTKPTIYTITYNLTNVTKDDEQSYSCMSDMADKVGMSNFYGYFKPATGYILDESCISVTMGGSPVNSSNYSWNTEYSYPGHDYTAELYMTKITGNVVVTVTGKTCTPLAAPTGLTLSTDHQGTAGKTRFGWNEVSGAAGYKVTVTKGDVSNSVTTASDRYYYITTFPDGEYTWTVQALGDGSTYCAEGTVANGTPFSYCHKDVYAVTPTVNATTSITKTGATANWTAVSDADHYTVKVYAGATATGSAVKTYTNVIGTSQAITGLTAGTQYCVTVQAHDACSHDSHIGTGGVFTTDAATLYTVTFHNAAGDAPGAVTQTTEGGTVNIPSAEACDGWTFVGWKIGGAQSSTTSDPTGSGYITSALWPKTDYVPEENIDVYAVFSKTEGGGGGEPTAYSVGNTGNFVLAAQVGDVWYALPTPQTENSGKITGVNLTVSETAGGVKYVTSANASGKTWTIANAANGQSISDGTKSGDKPYYLYHANGGSSGTNLAYGTGTTYTWKITSDTKGLIFAGQNGSTTNNRGMLFSSTNNNVFGGYSLSNKDASGYQRVQILPIAGGGTTTWRSDPPCESEYTVTYNAGDATSGTAPIDPNSPYAAGSQVTILGNTGNLAKTDKVFGGWSLTLGGSKAYDAGGTIASLTGNVTLYPYWVNPPYTVTFDAEGGTCGTSSLTEASGGAGVTLPAATATCAPAGWSFYGWATSASGSTTSAPTTVGTTGATYYPESDITLHAVYVNSGTYNSNPVCHEVTIGSHSNGTVNVNSSTTSPQSVTQGATVNIAATPSSGYNFTTWTITKTTGGNDVTSTLLGANATTASTSFTMPDYDVTVSATFTAKVMCTITWNVNGSTYTTGGPSDEAESGTKWSALTLPTAPADNTLSDCDRTKFVGWSTSQLVGDGNSAPSDLFKSTSDDNADSHTITGTTTFYAVFAKGSGDGWEKVSSAPDNWCGDYLLAYEASASSVYVWNGSTDASNYVEATPSDGLISKPTGGVEITIEHFGETANYAIKVKEGTNKDKYFKGNSSNGFTLEDTQQNTTIGSVEDIGFTFTNSSSYLRFNTTSGQTRFRYYKSSTAQQSSYKTIALYQQASNYSDYATQCCTLKPVTNLAVSSTTANSVTLTWTAPSPTTGIDHLELRNASTDAKIGSNIAVGTTTTTVSGLIECETYSYKIVSVGASCETSSEVVDAQPFSGAKTVTYNYHEGSGSPASFTTSCGNITTTLPTPTRTNYRFDGWYTEASGGTRKGGGGDSYTPDATITLHAQWTRVYTVSYAYAGGSGSCAAGGPYAEGETVTTCSTATKAGSTLTGWTRSDNSATVTKGNTFTMPASNVTLTAVWVDTPYTLTQNIGSHTTKGYTTATIKSGDLASSGLDLTYTISDNAYALPKAVTITGGGQTWRLGTNYTWSLSEDKHSATLHIEADLTISADVTVTVAEKARYTVIWDEHGSTTTEYYAADDNNVTMKGGIADCGEKKFYGWTEDAEFVSNPTTPPTMASSGAISGNKHYYAIFGDKSGGDGFVLVTSITAGEGYYMATGLTSSDKVYTGQNASNSYGSCTANNSTGSSFRGETLLAFPTAAKSLTVAISNGKFSLYDGTSYLGAANSNSLIFDDDPVYEWKLSDNKIQSQSYTSRYIKRNTGNERVCAYETTSGVADMHLYKPNVSWTNFSKTCTLYDIEITTPSGGEVTTTPAAGTGVAGEGQTVTVNVTPNSCKYLSALKYNDGSDHAISIASTPYTFTMPASDVTVTATFADKSVTSIVANTSTHRTLMQNTSFVGEQIRVTYNNGETEYLAWDDGSLTFSGYNMSTLGEQTVSVAYSGSCGSANTSYSIEITDGIPVTYNDGNITYVRKYKVGDIVGVDTITGKIGCSGYTFVGWSETEISSTDDEYVPVHNFTATTKTLYAVYSLQKKTGWMSIESADKIKSGAEYMYVKVRYSDKFALANTASAANSNYMAANIVTNYMGTWRRTSDNKDFQTFTGDAPVASIWQVIKQSTNYYLYNADAAKYLKITSSAIQLTTTPDDNFSFVDGYNDCEVMIKSSNSDYYASGYNSNSNYYFNPYSSEATGHYLLTRDSLFTTNPPCAPRSVTFHGNGGTVTASGGGSSGGNLVVTEATRDAGINLPTASIDAEDCEGNAWNFFGWIDHPVDVTRVPILTTDMLKDGYNPSDPNPHYDIVTDNEEFWAVYTNTGAPETKYGTISFTMSDFSLSYSSTEYTTRKTVTSMGEYVFGYVNIGYASQKGIQFQENTGELYNKTSLGKVNSISFTTFNSGDINKLKVYVGNEEKTTDHQLTAAEMQNVGSTWTYFPTENESYFYITNVGKGNGSYVCVSGISVDFGQGTTVYATTPVCSTISLSGDVYVTSRNGVGIMAATPLSVEAHQLAANADVVITSNSTDVYFSKDRNANFVKAAANQPKNSVTVTANASGELDATPIYVHYKPSSTGTGAASDVTVYANLSPANPNIKGEHTIHVRNLPEKFVIAAKVGGAYYALPADMNTATNPSGVVIEVDEMNMTAVAPNTCSYTIWPVKTTNTIYDRYAFQDGNAYGERVRFASVNNSNKALWANDAASGTTIKNWASISNLSDGSTGDIGEGTNSAYEWKITTTVVDGNWQYTLQTDQTINRKYLRYWSAASGGPQWGTYASGEQNLYFLPVTEVEPFEMQVVEWYPTKVLVQTEAALASPSVKVNGEVVASSVLTNKGGKLWEISGLPLESNPTRTITVSFTADEKNYACSKAIPVILSRSTKTQASEPFTRLGAAIYNNADLVVRDGAVLTVEGSNVANTFNDVTIYPTSKISVPSDKKLTVHSLTFFGGIDEIYDGSAYAINKYGVPELSLKGTLHKSIAQIDYVMRVDDSQMYSLTVPYDVNLADITYWDGTNMGTPGDKLWVSAYDGDARAKKDMSHTWIWEANFASKGLEEKLKAGVGYTISAGLQAGVGSTYSILRMPMASNVANDGTELAKTVPVVAHGINSDVSDNHKGWNLVGNPYMVAISGAEADSKLVVGYLKETGTGPWEWVDTYRYVTIPNDNGTDYYQAKFSSATLKPFKNFFLQIATSGDLSFALASRQNSPARYLEAQKREVEFEINLANGSHEDHTGLLIAEQYSPAYEINADLEKMIGSMSVYTIYGGYNLAYNALSPDEAKQFIPIGYVAPSAGEYTFSLDDNSDVNEIDHIYLTDYQESVTVDLMEQDYIFMTTSGKNESRFAINATLKEETDTPTDIDIINGGGDLDGEKPIKFIYHDKMYILRNGVLYDATGKKVREINK